MKLKHRATRLQAPMAASCLFTKNLFPSFSSTADTTLEFWRWSSAPCVQRYSLGVWRHSKHTQSSGGAESVGASIPRSMDQMSLIDLLRGPEIPEFPQSFASRRSTARGLFVCSSCCFSSFRPDWFWKRDLIISTTFGSADKLFFFVPCWCAADVMDVCNVVLLCCPVTPCSSCCVFNCFLLTVFTLQIRMTSIIYWKYLFYVPRWPTTR